MMRDEIIKLQNSLNKRIYEQARDINFLRAVFFLKQYIKLDNHYTYLHSFNVSKYCQIIGEELGFSSGECENLSLAGLLHDIGKSQIPLEILKKPSKLTENQFKIIQAHSQLGSQIIAISPCFQDLEKIVLYHHERIDGQGYPQGLKGNEIPLISRIVYVADSFDAMTTDRPYREGLSFIQAIEELQVNSGSQFDVEIVSAFLSALKKITKNAI